MNEPRIKMDDEPDIINDNEITEYEETLLVTVGKNAVKLEIMREALDKIAHANGPLTHAKKVALTALIKVGRIP